MNPLARARISARRDLAAQGYGPLYERIHQILLRHNPARLDLTRGDARDDYGSPVGTLIPRLKTVREHELQDVLCLEMRHWYPYDPLTPEQLETISKEIWQAWIEFLRPSN
jgi:hypothetical protein